MITAPFILTFDFAIMGAIWWLGGKPERIAVAILLGWGIADLFNAYFIRPDIVPTGFDGFVAATDVFEFVGMFALAVTANRMWPIAAAGVQLVCLGAHLAIAVLPLERGLTYYILTQGTGYLQLFIPLAGAAAHRVRVRAYGPYPDWRPKIPT